jgi:hypothetical protein
MWGWGRGGRAGAGSSIISHLSVYSSALLIVVVKAIFVVNPLMDILKNIAGSDGSE